MATGDFITVVFRTALFVLIRVPLTFILGLILALILNSDNLPGKTFLQSCFVYSMGGFLSRDFDGFGMAVLISTAGND